MICLGGFRIYTGGLIYGWRLVGIGWRGTWFLGFSVSTHAKENR